MRITQNAVMVTEEGEFAYLHETPKDGTRAKDREIRRRSDGAVVKATVIVANSVASLLKFLTGFDALEVKARSGYDQYYNDYGPTNPESPRSLTTDGLVKNIAVFTKVLHERVADGGVNGEEASKALALLAEYNTVAQNELVMKQRETLLQRAAVMFTPEELAKAKAKAGVVATPSVNVDEADDEVLTPSEVNA